jgi:DNA-binding Lrp family transcriptional regulator
MAKSSREQMKQDEKKILFELVKNSKKSIETIAKHCGFSKQKVWRAIKQMEENHMIWGYTSVFDEEKTDLKHFMLLVKRTAKQFEEKTANIIISRKLEDLAAELGITIESSSYVHGEYDWVITFTAEDIKLGKKFSDLVLTLHPGIIGKITVIQTLIFIKKQYILNPDKMKLKDFL